ncbi:MAG: hypothetical protein VYE77_06715 [Planctomycetota bacterium]|nr:hypothetical protein [Planctomycetota bacterium]
MGLTANQLHDALGQLFDQAMADSRMATDAQQARREYFGPDLEVAEAPQGAAALDPREVRFREWFLLERQSLPLGEVPLVALHATPRRDCLEDSLAGVFTVRAKDGERVTARDLQDEDGEILDLAAPDGTLLDGDLVVGRLYRDNLDSWVPSPAVAVYRPGQQLAVAMAGDLQRLGLDRRLWQIELEQLLLRQQQQLAVQEKPLTSRPVEHLEAELQRLFDQADEHYDVTEISEALLASERAGPVIGAILDELAFETKVDLERGRRLLLELWSAHHHHEFDPADAADGARTGAARESSGGDADEPGPAEASAPDQPMADEAREPSGETLGQRLARTLSDGLEAQEDVEKLFEKLEAMAGIDPEEEKEDDDDARAVLDAVMTSGPRGAEEGAATTDTGDFDPLMQEYLWETNQQDSPTHASLALFLQLQRNAAVPRTDLELLTGEDLNRFLLHVYLSGQPDRRADEVRQAEACVRGFLDWARQTQEYELDKVLDGRTGSLLDHLDRLDEASQALSTPGPVAEARPPALWRVVDVDEKGFGLRSEDSHYWVQHPRAMDSTLHEGDLLLGALAPEDTSQGKLSGLVVVLPGDAESLIR